MNLAFVLLTVSLLNFLPLSFFMSEYDMMGYSKINNFLIHLFLLYCEIRDHCLFAFIFISVWEEKCDSAYTFCS